MDERGNNYSKYPKKKHEYPEDSIDIKKKHSTYQSNHDMV